MRKTSELLLSIFLSAATSLSADNIYIDNQTGWTGCYLYLHNDPIGLHPLGSWPGIRPTSVEKVNSTVYERFEVPSEADGKTVWMVYHNNSSKVMDTPVVMNGDHYFTVDQSGFVETDPYSDGSEFMAAVNSKGGIINDLSDLKKISIDEPELGFVNFSGFTTMPVNKTDAIEGWVEFFDGRGNYFKKRIIAGAQGSSSLGFPKKNIKIDICEDEWIGDDTPDITFGDWVKQDGFHLKAYYIDYFRGVGAVSYRIYDDMTADRGDMALPWQRAGVEDADKKAKCHPDGFPTAVYLNGRFYGIYAWQLKKHRRNMGMNKNTPQHIHLDGEITTQSLFERNIDWTKFEIRNPKGLYCKDGSKYDGDNPRELIDEQSSKFDVSNEGHVMSAQVKKYITALSVNCASLNRFSREGYSREQMREEFEKRFDVDGFIDYTVFSSVVNNVDGWWKNWQWITYDGTKWFVVPYDLDMTFGNVSFGYFVSPPEYNWYYDTSNTRFVIPVGPAYYLHEYYADDLDRRYGELRDKRVITSQNIIGRITDWHDRIGEDLYAKEYSRWSDSFCNRDLITDQSWEWAGTWENLWGHPNWDASKNYREGDICQEGNMLWRAVEDNKGRYPVVRFGYRDGLDRISDWVERRIELEDRFWNYVPSGIENIAPDEPEDHGAIVRIHDICGARREALLTGINIVTYADGTTAKIIVH